MKVLKVILKFLASSLLFVLFVIFMNIIIFNTILNNTFLNVDYYQAAIYETEFANELRLITYDHLAQEIADDYEGELDDELVYEVTNEAFINAFDNNWFQNTMRLFAFNIVEYIDTGERGFYAVVQIDREQVEFRRQVGRSLNESLDDLSQDELVALTDEIEAASDLPETIELDELIATYSSEQVLDTVDLIPTYRDFLILGFYIIFAIFIFSYYALGGLIAIFRWLGIGIITGALVFGGTVYGFLSHLVIEQLSGIGLSNEVIMAVLDLLIKYSVVLWIGILVLGIITLVISILIGRAEKNNRQTPKKSQKRPKKVKKEVTPTKEEFTFAEASTEQSAEPEIIEDDEFESINDTKKASFEQVTNYGYEEAKEPKKTSYFALAEEEDQSKEDETNNSNANQSYKQATQDKYEKITADEFYKKVAENSSTNKGS